MVEDLQATQGSIVGGSSSSRDWNGRAGSTSDIDCDRRIEDGFDLSFDFGYDWRSASRRNEAYSNWNSIFINDHFR